MSFKEPSNSFISFISSSLFLLRLLLRVLFISIFLDSSILGFLSLYSSNSFSKTFFFILFCSFSSSFLSFNISFIFIFLILSFKFRFKSVLILLLSFEKSETNFTWFLFGEFIPLFFIVLIFVVIFILFLLLPSSLLIFFLLLLFFLLILCILFLPVLSSPLSSSLFL